MSRHRWFDRHFELGLPAEALPDIIERLRGTPVRLEEQLQGFSRELVVRRLAGAWSIQENVGHLLDLEPLQAARLDDLLAGAGELRPADLENRKTHEARHNEQEFKLLLGEFRAARMATVARLEALNADELRHSGLHPRLKQPMTIVDLFFFVAEHDDHHLARITEIARAVAAV